MLNYATNSPLNDARHSLIFLDGFDENTQSTCFNLIKISFIRIGNSNNGSQSEKITYQLILKS